MSDIQERLEATIRKHIRPIKAKKTPKARKRPDDKSLFVIFGERAFACTVDGSESELFAGHAVELSKSVHVLQRMLTRIEWDPNCGEFWVGYRDQASVGLDFLSGMVAEMLEASKAAFAD